MCAPPHPVTLDAAAVGGLANRPLPLDQVRARLLDRACPLPVRDAVWAHLITRSRVEAGTWTLACAGMALPMLAAVCRTLCGGHGVPGDDVASGIVTGFLTGLARVELHRPGLATSLRWAAVRGGHTVLREQRRAPQPLSHDWLVRVVLTPTAAHPPTTQGPASHPGRTSGAGAGNDTAQAAVGSCGGVLDTDPGRDEHGHGLGPVGRWESAPPPVSGGHPDLVLAAAVADGVLSRAEASLIGETRLEATTLAQAAARRGRTVGAVTMQRLRAEMRLVDHLRTTYYTQRAHHTADHTLGDTLGDTADGYGHTCADAGDGNGHTAAAPGRDPQRPQRRRRQRRSVTGHRSGAAGPRAPRCGRERSPSVNPPDATGTTGTPGTTDGRRGGRGGDGPVAR